MRILNASPGFGTQLTEEEIKNFLGNSKLNIHIGTIDNKGDPNIHPTWYYFDATNNKLYIETYKGSKKVENLNTRNTVYYCVDDPNPPYKGVRGKGKVKIHGDINHNIQIAEKIMVRYLGSSNVIDFLFIVRLLMHITFPIINSVKSVSIGIIKLLTNLTLFSSTRSLKHVLSDCLNGTEIVILNKLPSLGKSI